MKLRNHIVDYINAHTHKGGGGLRSAEGIVDRKAPTLKVVVLEIFV
jgi:hypothetical protein